MVLGLKENFLLSSYLLANNALGGVYQILSVAVLASECCLFKYKKKS